VIGGLTAAIVVAAFAADRPALAAPPENGSKPAPSPPAEPASTEVPYELTRPPRPPLPKARDREPIPWQELIQIGGEAVYAIRPVRQTDNSQAMGVNRYKNTLGFGLHARWEMFSFLRFTAYFVDLDHSIEFGQQPFVDPKTAPNGRAVSIASLETFAFGARFQPYLRITTRLAFWASAGIGWGRMEFGRMRAGSLGTNLDKCQLSTTPPACFEVRERSDPFVEYPLGFGIGFDIIPKWITLEYEFQGSFISDQNGSAITNAQAIDPQTGRTIVVPGFPPFAASFTNALGLSLRL
jgi:hypothetical protein